MATASDALLSTQFPSGEAAVTHVKRFCFATSRRTCRLERTKSGGNCKLLVCTSHQTPNARAIAIANSHASSPNDECPWFVRVNRSRRPNERGWRVKDANLQHSERCLSALNTSNCVPDARTIAYTLVVARSTHSVAVGLSPGAGVNTSSSIGTVQTTTTTTLVDADTPARVLKEQIKTALGVDVKNRTIYRLKTTLLRIQDDGERSIGGSSVYSAAGVGGTSVAGATVVGSTTTADRYIKSFQWIESLLLQFCELNAGSVAELQVDNGNRFQRAIVVPKQLADVVVNAQHNNKESTLQRVVSIQTQSLVCEKSSSTNWVFNGTQVSLVAHDSNLQKVVVARAILREQEPDQESFRWVLERLKAAGIDFNGNGGDVSPLLVSCDRSPDSAFVRALQEMHPSSSLTNLIFSSDALVRYMLREKLVSSQVEQKYVIQAQKAERMEDFRAILDNLRVYRPQAASFLESLDPRTWALYANLDRRLYGWTGGDQVQGDAAGGQPQSPFECLYECMSAMMKGLFERSENARKWNEASISIRVTPAAQRLLNQELSVMNTYDVQPCNPELVYVRHVRKSADHWTRKVNLRDKTCTCAFFQQLGVPCRHIGAALTFAGKMDNAYEFFDTCYAVSSYTEAFGGKFVQIPLEEDLQLNLNHLPPERTSDSIPVVSSDRPNKRKVQGHSTGATRSYKCSNCASIGGHNKKTCPLARQ